MPQDNGIPSIYQLIHIFFNEEACVAFLFEHGVFDNERICPECDKNMQLSVNRGTFRCSTKACRKELSIKAGSFFSNHRLACSKILLVGYLWLAKSIITITGHSDPTIGELSACFRQLVESACDEEDTVIGGEGVIVEIDETKLGKRKYNRGHRVEGVWVVGGVERTAERRVFWFLSKIVLPKQCAILSPGMFTQDQLFKQIFGGGIIGLVAIIILNIGLSIIRCIF